MINERKLLNLGGRLHAARPLRGLSPLVHHRALVACVSALIGFLGIASLALAQLRLPSPPVILGCTLSVDLIATAGCLNAAVAREATKAKQSTDTAVAAAEATLKAQMAEMTRQAAKDVAIAQAKTESLIKSGPNYAQLPWQQDILRRVKNQGALFTCMDQDPAIDFMQLGQSFTGNPGAFFSAQTQSALMQVRANWATLMKPELDSLTAGRIASLDRPQMVHLAVTRLAQSAQSVPAAKCVINHSPVTQAQVQPLIEFAALQVIALLEQQMRAILLEQIVPRVQQGVTASLRANFQQLTTQGAGAAQGELLSRVPFLKGLTLSEEEIQTVARGVLLERQFRAPLIESTAALNKLAALIRQKSPAAALRDARSELANAYPGTEDWDVLYLELGIEMLRAVGHKYIDSDNPGHGGYLLNYGVSSLQLGEATVENLVSALCGLIPEVGAAACAVLQEVVAVAWNEVAIPNLESLASATIHSAFNAAIDRAKPEILKGEAVEEIRKRNPAYPFIAALPHEKLLHDWAYGTTLKDVEAFNHHSEAVKQFADAATES